MVTRVDEEDVAEERKIFESLDKNRDGYITEREMRKGLGTVLSNEEIESIMHSCDQDHNGAISYNEFLAATLSSRICKDKKLIEKAFGFFDKDGDGVISLNELKQIFLADGTELATDETFHEMINEVDANGDGDIDYEEFMRCLSVETILTV